MQALGLFIFVRDTINRLIVNVQRQPHVLFPCSKCGKNDIDNQTPISCDECGSWTHQVCVCAERLAGNDVKG